MPTLKPETQSSKLQLTGEVEFLYTAEPTRAESSRSRVEEQGVQSNTGQGSLQTGTAPLQGQVGRALAAGKYPGPKLAVSQRHHAPRGDRGHPGKQRCPLKVASGCKGMKAADETGPI